MEMSRELYDRIQETAKTEVLHIGTKDYTTEKVYMVEDPIYFPENFCVNTLAGLAEILKTEIDRHTYQPMIVNVRYSHVVEVFAAYDDRFVRSNPYTARFDSVPLTIGQYMPHEEFMIELRSKYVRNDDVEYLLGLLASVVDENSVKSTDNGLSQKVEVQKGITTIGEEIIKPIVSLAPYRTFLEVEQPESEFLVRLKEGGQIGLFEADGGAWKLKAKENVAAYLRNDLKQLIEAGKLVVTE